MRTCSSKVVLATAVCAAVVLGACTVSLTASKLPVPVLPALRLGNPTAPVIDQPQARRIVEAVWPLREEALARDDLAVTSMLEDASAAQNDNAVSRDDRGRGVTGRGRRIVRSHTIEDVIVPPAQSYPASFLAEVRTTVYGPDTDSAVPAGTPFMEMMVFTRHDAGASWHLSLVAGYLSTTGPLSVLPGSRHEGFAPDGLAATGIDPAQVHPMLAAYWQHWRDTGSAPDPTPFQRGFWTNARGQEIASEPQDGISSGCRCGVHLTYSSDPEHDGLYIFNLDGTTELACSTVRVDKTYSARSRANGLFQNDDRSSWGGLLAPGVYAQIRSSAAHTTCIQIGAGKDQPLMVVAGADGAWATVTGVL